MKNAEKLFCNIQEWSHAHNTGSSFAQCGESYLNTSGSVSFSPAKLSPGQLAADLVECTSSAELGLICSNSLSLELFFPTRGHTL